MVNLKLLKICIVVGTRPEIIKMSPIIKECQKRNIEFDIIHSKQHFSDNMSDVFFRELGLPIPQFSLKIKEGGHAHQIASLLLEFDKIFSKSSYDIVLVQGDTNTVFAAAIIASRYLIHVGHVEAGLRSGDKTMPEETNRIMVDHISSLLFATSNQSEKNLLVEGISKKFIWNTGNTIVDATLNAIENAKKKPFNHKLYKDFIFLTLHRPNNVDVKENLMEILQGVQNVSDKYNLLVAFPVHPRTKETIRKCEITLSPKFQLLEPLGYLECLSFENNARLIMTDSGGIQEEACILQTPCVTLRKNTERPETLAVGANMLGGTIKEDIMKVSEKMLKTHKTWEIPYGDGTSAKKILDIIIATFQLQ